jgi:type IV pilus biogenesis protein PilP
MADDKLQMVSGMTTRQKVTIAVLVIIVLVILWQLIGLFRGPKVSTPTPARNATAPRVATPAPAMPQPAALPPKPAPMSQRELELMRLQQETQAKYLAALSELQMLKVTRDIAETNQAIAAAKLATVTAQKKTITELTGPVAPIPQGAYASALTSPTGATPTETQPQPPVAIPQETSYTVISVSQLRYRWSAVIGYQGNLYSVSVGDILPPDGSRVVNINKSGVTLERNNVRRRVSLVPII